MISRILLKTIEWGAAALIIAAIAEGGAWVSMYYGLKHRD